MLHLRGYYTLSFLRKVYSRVLEWRLYPIVEAWIQDEQCESYPSHQIVDELFALAGLLEGRQDFAHPVYIFCRESLQLYPPGNMEKVWGTNSSYMSSSAHVIKVSVVSSF